MLSCLFISALWSLAGKGLTSWLLFVIFNCVFVTFPCGILGQEWYLFVSIPDLCCLSYFAQGHKTVTPPAVRLELTTFRSSVKRSLHFANPLEGLSTNACFQILLIFSLFIMLLYTCNWIEVNKIFQQSGMCDHQSLRSAWTNRHSDQSLC